MPLQSGWAVVVSKPAAEEEAARAIELAGYRVYLPRHRLTLRGVRLDEAGKRIRTRGPGAVVRRPLFRGYLFAALYEGQSEMALATAAGVGGILHHRLPDGTRGPAWLVRDAVIEAIRTEVDSGRWDQVDLEPGNEVRISDEAGLWAGMIAKLVAVDEKMARVLIQFLGREDVPTSVPTHLLSVVIS